MGYGEEEVRFTVLNLRYLNESGVGVMVTKFQIVVFGLLNCDHSAARSSSGIVDEDDDEGCMMIESPCWMIELRLSCSSSFDDLCLFALLNQ